MVGILHWTRESRKMKTLAWRLTYTRGKIISRDTIQTSVKTTNSASQTRGLFAYRANLAPCIILTHDKYFNSAGATEDIKKNQKCSLLKRHQRHRGWEGQVILYGPSWPPMKGIKEELLQRDAWTFVRNPKRPRYITVCQGDALNNQFCVRVPFFWRQRTVKQAATSRRSARSYDTKTYRDRSPVWN